VLGLGRNLLANDADFVWLSCLTHSFVSLSTTTTTTSSAINIDSDYSVHFPWPLKMSPFLLSVSNPNKVLWAKSKSILFAASLLQRSLFS
jgi:hypothetical protein